MSAAAEDQHAGGPSSAGGPGDLVAALADLARQMQQQSGSEATLEKAVAAAIAMVPGAQEGSISVVVKRTQVQAWAASCELPRSVDELQSETGEGPCLDAAFEAEVVDVPDVAGEVRWRRFAEGAAQLGAGSMLCFRLFVSGDDLGALNLYARTPRAFTGESRQVGLPFAHAAVALAQVQQREHLLAAIDSRDLIGQAKGILMERHKLTAAQAFDLLTSVSQHRGVKLRDLAHELTSSGQLRGPRGTV
ncbi:GAF and ANTAR domain-containing protein [Kineococcus arenarius]|uniref:GAF and ANTAR domain-containing protein n=1 Tax=Kineococcus sp. SYSU DK007 TaxID=3383128 RepID=UPI003D7EAC6F